MARMPSEIRASADRVWASLRVVPVLIALASFAWTLHPAEAHAGLRVLACEPVWAALAGVIGGPDVTVESATTPKQDPHYIQARPSLMSKARRADLLICSGAEMEVGWLPVLLRQAGNPGVQPGAIGNIEVAQIVPMLDIPTQFDRALGDLHPGGNPHVETDPRNLIRVAAELAKRLVQLDASGAEGYEARAQAFHDRWTQAVRDWEERAAPLRGMEIVTHHSSWVYLVNWLGLVDVAHLEPKPGIPPSASHLAGLLARLEEKLPKAIVRHAYEPERPSAWLAKRTGMPALVLPHAPGATDPATDLFAVYDEMIRLLLEANR